MRGQVLGVDTRSGQGMVSGEDGRRYSFTQQDWAAAGEPAIGMQVDFETDQSRAVSIFPVPNAAPSLSATATAAPINFDRNRLVAALIAFLLGTLGVHRFYLGRVGTGILMLVLSCTFFGLIVTVPWALIDMIRYLMMSDREFAARYARAD